MVISLVRTVFTSSINSRLQTVFRHYWLILFIALTYIVFSSIKNYVTDTLSITLIQPEIINPPEELAAEETVVTVKILKGETLHSILAKQHLSKEEIIQILNLPKVKEISTSLQIGQKIVFEYDYKITEDAEDDLATESRNLSKITFEIDKINNLEVIKTGDQFVAKLAQIALSKVIKRSHVIINSNFISTLKTLGLPTNSIVELVNAYSHQIDFQRQIKTGDSITVITEKFMDKDGNFSHYGKVLYASLNASDKKYNIYRYSPDNSKNNHKFFSEDGKSVQRSLLRTPIKLIRVTSHYGSRKHPILGYTKMHKGVDFAAPVGTPIYAAGDGVITEMCYKGGYGKFIQIKHTATLSTAYAHASRFAKNLKVGDKIKQGQEIAYVGVTGRTTGAHLHYEVKIEGKHVNPMSIKTTPNVVLAKQEMEKFKKFKANFQKLDKDLVNLIEVAANDI